MKIKSVFRFIYQMIIAIPIIFTAGLLLPFLLIKTFWLAFHDWLDFDNLTFKEAWKSATERI